MTKYCKCDFLNNLLDNRLPIVIRNGYSLEKDKEIPYGIQLFFTKNSEDDGTEKKFIINLYYTEKKGLKIVSNIKKEDADNEKLIDIISEFKNNNAVSNLTNFNVRIGTDESGKGDYFGPLVTAGFIVDNSIVPDLIKIGIQDSKRISDENIKKMAQYLYDNYSDRISICEISPEKYNNLYDSMKKRGKNLNHLLAWSHARVIENLLVKGYKVEGIISDKFGNDNLIENALMSNGRKFKLIQKTKAEEDIAVATASVLARCRFIGRLEEMNEKYNMKFPKGAGEKVPDALEEFILNHGKENLNKVAKVHFSITEKTLI